MKKIVTHDTKSADHLPLSDPQNNILLTEHLILRQLCLEDAPFILELFNTPGWLKYIGDRGVANLEQAEHYLQERLIKSYHELGFGFWQIVLKNQLTPIGICGLVKRAGLPDVDLGYALLPAYTGKGYALEAASATLSYARHNLGLGRILAITTPDNAASIRLLQKIGLRLSGTTILPGQHEAVCLFSTP
jgi:ribosomal-protein-alanine N-acetyltransferase